MWKASWRAAWVGVAIVGGSWSAACAVAASPADDVKTSLSTLHDWLGRSAGSSGWRKFLKSDQLEAELAKGPAADKNAVAAVLNQYSSQTSGLDRAQFAAVRQSLKQWLAELSQTKLEELPAAARTAAGEFTPPDAQRIAKARAKLAAALGELDRWLGKSGPKTTEGWRRFLGWDELHKQLAEGIEPDFRIFDAVATRYKSNEVGLELARFAAVRNALTDYARAVEFSSEDKLKQELPKLLEELAARLEAYGKSGAGDDAAAIGRLLGWLENARQAPALVAGVRSHFERPNVYAQVSRRLLDAGLTEDVDDTSQVADYILKTDIEGTAHTRGRIGIELVPATEHAALDILMAGNAFSDTVGYQGPVVIYSTGNTSIHARKRLFIDATGIRTRPAVANCETSTNINDIDAPLRLIERIAWRKAGQSQGQAEEIASGKAEQRVAQQMDARVAALVANSNASFVGKFRNPLLRRGAFPRELKFGTSKDRLLVKGLQAGAAQLAAPNSPPEVEGQGDLSIRVHESIVGNFSESVIGGETLTDKRLAEMMKEATGNVPEELQLSPDKDPWSITFDTVQPVSALFTEQGVKLAIRGQRFTRGDTTLKESMQISAVYKIERTPSGAKLVRQGDVTVEYVKGGRLSVQQVAFKTFMRRKFDALFKPEVVREGGLALPGRLEQAGPLQLEMVNADKGWLVAAWKMPEKARTAQNKPK